jgi:hypothetical protein
LIIAFSGVLPSRRRTVIVAVVEKLGGRTTGWFSATGVTFVKP